VKAKLTAEQRDKIISMLREGFDRSSIALAVRVTPGQVSAVAAHVTMKTYKGDPSSTQLQDAKVSKVRTRSKGVEKRATVKVPIGKDTKSDEMWFWCPTPDSGTPNPHLLIVGESGSGKTYATQCICAELAQRGLPTIVFDFGQGFALNTSPREFTEFAMPIEINVGKDGININPLQIFPSDIHGPINVAQRIADTFARVYPTIGVQQHAILRDAILDAFLNVGIDARSKKTWTLKPPRFNDLKLTLETIAQDKDHPSRRFAAAVASHISTVFVFNTFRSTGLDLSWETILSRGGRTYIVQLKGLEHLLERVVTELLLWNLIGFIESLGPGPLRCLVLLDEAHRLSFASNSPVEKLLREGRKFGIGVVLASQQPEDFSSVAFTNTASKLVFNVTDERGAVARQIARKSSGDANFLGLIRQLGSLPRGQACFLTSDSAGIVEVTDFANRIARWKLSH
jgi:DNA phosphorothioation-dependent restriction protein DptH